MLSIHSYSNNLNLGDAIQTIALQRLLKQPFVYEDRNEEKNPYNKYICNGWLNERWVDKKKTMRGSKRETVFAGVHFADEAAYEQATETSRLGCDIIGCRDPHTYQMCSGHKMVNRELIGCATLTLPRYYGPRKGVIYVDYEGPDQITHKRQFLNWDMELTVADGLLYIYQRAEHVITTRLHVALPCLAFGTPITLHYNESDPEGRFGLVRDYFGIQSGRKYSPDTRADIQGYATIQELVEHWSNKYINFLNKQLIS